MDSRCVRSRQRCASDPASVAGSGITTNSNGYFGICDWRCVFVCEWRCVGERSSAAREKNLTLPTPRACSWASRCVLQKRSLAFLPGFHLSYSCSWCLFTFVRHSSGPSRGESGASLAQLAAGNGVPRLGLRRAGGAWLNASLCVFCLSTGFHSDQSQAAGRGLVSIWWRHLCLHAAEVTFAFYTQETCWKPKPLKPAGWIWASLDCNRLPCLGPRRGVPDLC